MEMEWRNDETRNGRSTLNEEQYRRPGAHGLDRRRLCVILYSMEGTTVKGKMVQKCRWNRPAAVGENPDGTSASAALSGARGSYVRYLT
jgi:hypothetical protein